ncbi:unnamed protein product [Ixodes pacificus]
MLPRCEYWPTQTISRCFVQTESVREAIALVKRFCNRSGSAVNWEKCIGFWQEGWDVKPSVFENVKWVSCPVKYLGVPLESYRDSDPFRRTQVVEVQGKAEKWRGKDLSVFARSTVCNVFLISKLWYVLQVLHCSRVNIQKLHRVFAVFIWGSSYERTSRTCLFRSVSDGGLALSHLFLKQLVNRFLFLRKGKAPFLSTVCQVRLCNVLPEYIVSSEYGNAACIFGYMREVVGAYKFLRARFSLEYLSEVTRKKLYQDLVDVTLPVPLYRALYSTGSWQDVLKRVKRMSIPACVKTFFFKLHTGTLPVKTWMVERGMFVAWGNHCFLCKKPEPVEHVFLDCWDAIFFWDVLQRTLKKEFPLDSHGIRFL